MWANLASPTNFPKRPFWRVLKFDKNGKFSASTQIRQIRRRVAIAYLKLISSHFQTKTKPSEGKVGNRILETNTLTKIPFSNVKHYYIV
jgi:hypothetical protein